MTAVKKLLDYITRYLTNKQLNFFSLAIIEAVKLNEKQIKDAYNQGFRDGKEEWDIVLPKDVSEYSNAQNYYNETFGGNNEQP